MNYYNFIKIKGDLNPVNFMNILANKINNLFKTICSIKESKYKLKFKNKNKEEDNENEEKEENNEKDDEDNLEENIFKRNSIIQIELF